MAAVPPKGNPNTTAYNPLNGDIIGRYDASGNFVAGTQSVAATNRQAGAAPVSPGQTPNSGFAARYAPGALQDMVYDSPETVLYDVFQQMGLGGSQGSGLYQSLADFGGADPLSLYLLQTGGAQDSLAGGGAGDYTNWLAAQYQNAGTAGGGAFNFQDLMGNVFGQADSDKNTSVLYNTLSAGTPTQQVSNLYNMARDAGRVGLNPLAQAAMLTSIQRGAQGYTSDSMQGLQKPGTENAFYSYLAQQNPGLVSSLTGR